MSESSLSNQEKEEDRPIKACRPSIDRLFTITWIVLSWTVLAWMFGMNITASGTLLEMGEAFVVLWALVELVFLDQLKGSCESNKVENRNQVKTNTAHSTPHFYI